MTSNEQKRIKDIKARKRQREQKRKKTMKIVLGIAAVIIVGVIIAAAVSCSGDKNKNPEVTVNTTAAPHMTESPKGSKDVDTEFYKDSCFLGGQFIADMMDYELVEGADYFAQIEGTVGDSLEEDTVNNLKPLVDEVDNDSVYKKVFISFGDSELGINNTSDFKKKYKSVISKVKEYQPKAKIYVLGITPVTEAVDSEHKDGITNSNIEKMNTVLKEIADDTDTTYCDLFEAVANSKDVLPDSAASDGIHLDKSYFEKCLVYIQKNYGTSQTTSPTEKASSSSSTSSDSSSNNSSSSSSSQSSSDDDDDSSDSSSSSNSSGSSSSSRSSASSSNSSSSQSSSSSTGGSSSGSSSSSSSSGGRKSSTSSSSETSSSTTSSSSSSTEKESSSSSESSSDNSSSSSGSTVQKDLDSGVTKTDGEAAKKNLDE